MKHTQENWKVFRHRDGCIAVGYKVKSTFTIAKINSSFPLRDESEANAKLIAAAPSLLEALIILQKAYRNAVKLHDPNTHDAVSILSHNAIAKAITP